jgi:hypothetical protein
LTRASSLSRTFSKEFSLRSQNPLLYNKTPTRANHRVTLLIDSSWFNQPPTTRTSMIRMCLSCIGQKNLSETRPAVWNLI